MRELQEKKELFIDGKRVLLDDVSHICKADSIAVVIDTLPCQAAVDLAQGVKLLLCESTYLESHRHLAEKHSHLTALQAAEIAKEAKADMLVLTHFSARYQDLEEFAREARTLFAHTFIAQDLKIIPF